MRHLPARFDLKHTNCAGFLQHGVDAVIAFGNIDHSQWPADVVTYLSKRITDRNQYAQRQYINLE
jgi:hypothetical protein